MIDWDLIERGFGLLLEFVREDPRVHEEFEGSRGEFFSGPSGARAPGAVQRHVEWFLLERPCAALGGVPVQVWQERWRAASAREAPAVGVALLQSLAGAFEVTSLATGEGIWVRDLFTRGEHPVADTGAAETIALGDLLVGRLFPAGGGVFVLSPAVSLFRSPQLLGAVRKDLEEMQAARRGVLRVQQLELERLFHSGGLQAASEPGAGGSPADPRGHAREALAGLGIGAMDARRIVERVWRAGRSGSGRTVTEVLNSLAFGSTIDLVGARLILTELWHAAHSEAASPAPAAVTPGDARTALEAFDRGRAEGRDLEALFRALERDLGVDGEAEAADPEGDLGAPDFPGVVGAMVEEFLWDVEREQGEDDARAAFALRSLSEYGSEIGLFEELGPARLLDYSARWLLDETDPLTPQELSRSLDALAAFCRWCEERHEVPLWTQFGATLTELRDALPRHARLRARSGTRDEPGLAAGRVVSIAPGAFKLRAPDGTETIVPAAPEQLADLRDGDHVHIVRRGTESVLGRTYPGLLPGAPLTEQRRPRRPRGSAPPS